MMMMIAESVRVEGIVQSAIKPLVRFAFVTSAFFHHVDDGLAMFVSHPRNATYCIVENNRIDAIAIKIGIRLPHGLETNISIL